MVMSALSAPVYARSLLDAALRRKSKFVVTPKGDSASPDTLFGTFRIHLFFILVFAASMAASFVYGHAHPAMITWATFALLITAAPIFAWRWGMRQDRKKAGSDAGAGPSGPPSAAGPADPAAALPRDATAPLPQAQPPASPRGRHAAPHAPQQKPSWASPDQTMQISLGGRKK
ncbi:cellulose synthase (UDP-forming) OS=Streptomyces alboniger OX=132473 GN=CP975_12790 PE=4 SV=1 [Streptomyces alboniger]